MRTLVTHLILMLFTGAAIAQTNGPVTQRIFEEPGNYDWTQDLQVILALVGVPESEVRYRDWIRDLDPDFNDWSSTDHNAILRGYGVHSSSSAGPYQEISPEEESLVERFRGNGIGAFIDGRPALGHIPWGYRYFMCHNNDGWHEYKKGIVLNQLPQVSGINQDNIGGAWKGDIGFCSGCQEVFRAFLRKRFSQDEIRSMGITDLKSFTLVDYLQKKYNGETGNHLVKDTVIRQYILAQNLSQQARWRDIVESVHNAESRYNRAFPCTGNQQGGQEWSRPYNLLLSEVNDIVAFESDPWYDEFEHPRPSTAGVKFKLAHASGRYEKAVWVRGGLYDRNRKAEDGHSFRMRLYGQVFQDLVHGEAFANGAVRAFNLANEGAPPPEPDYELRKPFYQRFIDYAELIHAHRSALQDRQNAAEVALVYSMPTQFWESFSSLGINSTEAFARYSGWARALEEMHIPYEVLILGHSELFPDGKMLDRLPKYRSVILPGVACMTEIQAQAVRQYVRNGGAVIWSGDLATYDENLNPQSKPLLEDFPRLDRQHVGDGRIVGILHEDRDYRQSVQAREQPNPTDFHVMREAVMWSLDGEPQVVSDARPETQFNIWMADNRRSVSIHLINYHVDLMRDYVEPQLDVRVTVRLPEDLEPVNQLTLVAPGEKDIRIPFLRKGQTITFTIPDLRVWAMAVLSDGREQEVATTLANARKQIRKHVVMGNDSGNWVQRYEAAFTQYQARQYEAALQSARRLLSDATPRLDNTGSD